MHCFKSPTVAALRLSSSLPARLSARSSTRSITSAFLRPSASIKRTTLRPAAFAAPRRAFSHSPILKFSPSATMAGAVEVIKTPADFKAKVLDSQDLVVLDCFAEWCGPCKAIAPKLDEFAATYTQAKFYKIDVDELAEVAAELGVRAMPTFMLFKNGEKVADVVGANPPALEAGIKNLVA